MNQLEGRRYNFLLILWMSIQDLLRWGILMYYFWVSFEYSDKENPDVLETHGFSPLRLREDKDQDKRERA